MTVQLFRNTRAAYSSYNFRSDDGRWEWQIMQDRWRSEKLSGTDSRLAYLLALTDSPLVRALGGS